MSDETDLWRLITNIVAVMLILLFIIFSAGVFALEYKGSFFF